MIIKNSEECGKSELDLFSIPPTQIAVEEGFYDEILPHPNFRQGTIQFEIKADNEHYIDLSETELWMMLTLCKKDTEEKIKDYKAFGLANNTMHSIFSQLQISVNNVEIENSNSCYSYRSYFENLLCYGDEAKKTFLAPELFVKDTAGNMDSLFMETKTGEVTEDKLNQGMIARMKKFAAGNAVQVRGPLHADFFKSYRYLLPSVSVQIKLSRHEPKFYIMAEQDPNAHVVVTEAFLRVRRNRVNPSVYANHLMMLEKQTAKYPLDRVLMKSVILPFSSNIATITNIFNGILPSRVCVAFVTTAAAIGGWKLNPFNFQNFGINYMRLKLGARAAPYSNGLRMSFPQSQYLQGYNTLFQGLNGGPNDITYEEFAKGYAVYSFSLSPDGCHSNHYNILKVNFVILEISIFSFFIFEYFKRRDHWILKSISTSHAQKASLRYSTLNFLMF
jgi:hypothetical protein